MALVVKDRVQETSTTTGTGSLTLLGAVTGFQTFSSAIGNTNTTYYTIQNGAEWEVGVGTVSAGALSRDTVLESSNSGSLVNFSAGTKFVFCTYPAEKSVYYDASNNVNIDITGNAATVTNGVYTSDIGSTVQAYDADTTKNDVANTFTENQTLQKNLIFTGTGNRITGDFSNATVANRVAFQSSTTNADTFPSFLPNGTSVASGINIFNNSDPTNAGIAQFRVSSTEVRLASAITGTGTYQPMTFYNGGSERMRIDSSGNVGIGATPSAWDSDLKIIQFPYGSIYDFSDGLGFVSSGYFDGANWKYTQASPVSIISLNATGTTTFLNAPTGTVGTNIPFVERMRIDSSGNVGIGTNGSGGKLDVAGTTSRIRWQLDTAKVTSIATNAAANAYAEHYFDASFYTFNTSATERMRIDASGNLQFNSGYGSVATAYGCRAWVNFNGTGTVAIRASGNVSSITDNGTGNYDVNFTTAMPDINYSMSNTAQGNAGASVVFRALSTAATPLTTTSCPIEVNNDAGSAFDSSTVTLAFFR
jgi:hypothetical protein